MNKKIIKIIVDVCMLMLFPVLMAFHLTGNSTHEWLGTCLVVLVIWHNALNWKWYRSILKGKYTLARSFHTTINLLLAAALIGIIISGVLLSTEVFGFLHLSAAGAGRRLHMLSTSWAFVLMAVHMGFHFALAGRRCGDNLKTAVLVIGGAVFSAFGLYASISHQLWQKMFLAIQYANFDFAQPAAFFYFDQGAIIIFFACVGYCSHLMLKKGRKHEIQNIRKNGTFCQ